MKVISADHSGCITNFDGNINDKELKKTFDALKQYTDSDYEIVSCSRGRAFEERITNNIDLDNIVNDLINGKVDQVGCTLSWEEEEYDDDDEYENEDRWTEFSAYRRGRYEYFFSGSYTDDWNSLLDVIESFDTLDFEEEEE